MTFISLGFLTALITFVLIFGVKYLFPKIGLLDDPKKYGFTRKPVPYPAGIIIPIIFFGFAFFIMPINKAFIGFFVASIILVITSFIDDRRSIKPYIRLGIQLICAIIIIASGIGINDILNPFGGKIDINSFSIGFGEYNFHLIADSLILIWIILIINSINWFDGVSGNVSGLGAVSGWILFFLADSQLVAQHDIAQIALVLAIICSIFFIFEIDPPRLLLGDSGSMFIGFTIAILSIIAGGKIAITLILISIPIIDAIYTIYRRIQNGQSPYKGDMDHLHHVLLKRGLGRKTVVITYCAICLIFGIISLQLGTTGKYITIFVLIISTLCIELMVRKNLKE